MRNSETEIFRIIKNTNKNGVDFEHHPCYTSGVGGSPQNHVD